MGNGSGCLLHRNFAAAVRVRHVVPTTWPEPVRAEIDKGFHAGRRVAQGLRSLSQSERALDSGRKIVENPLAMTCLKREDHVRVGDEAGVELPSGEIIGASAMVFHLDGHVWIDRCADHRRCPGAGELDHILGQGSGVAFGKRRPADVTRTNEQGLDRHCLEPLSLW